MTRWTTSLVALIAVAVVAAQAHAVSRVATLDDLPLAPESAYYGQDNAGGFTSGRVTFPNDYTDFGGGFFAWDGFAYSNKTDNATPGFGNQFSAITGSGVNGSENYGLSFSVTELPLKALSVVNGMYITNTTYAALSMLQGDFFAKQFGGPTGDDPDFFALDITGLDSAGNVTGVIEFLLADYRFTDNTQDYVVDGWTWVDLSSLGLVQSLAFSYRSTDVGQFGINTPTYFAFDDFTYSPLPEPTSAALLGLAAVSAVTLASRRRRA